VALGVGHANEFGAITDAAFLARSKCHGLITRRRTCVAWRCSGYSVLARDSGGRGFDSRPFHFQLTTLGKLFTHMCLMLHPAAVQLSPIVLMLFAMRRLSFYLFYYCYVCTSFRLILYLISSTFNLQNQCSFAVDRVVIKESYYSVTKQNNFVPLEGR